MLKKEKIRITKEVLDTQKSKKQEEMLNLLLFEAIKGDDILFARFALVMGANPNEKHMEKAIKQKNEEIVKILIDSGAIITKDLVHDALKSEEIGIIRLFAQEKILGIDELYYAIKNRLAVSVEFLCDLPEAYVQFAATMAASMTEGMEYNRIVEITINKGLFDKNTINYMIPKPSYKHLERKLLEKGAYTPETLLIAAEHGHIETVKKINESMDIKQESKEKAAKIAFEKGYHTITTYLLELDKKAENALELLTSKKEEEG